MGVHVRVGVIGSHEELVHAAGEHVLLELGVIDGRGAGSDGHHARVLARGAELGRSLERVQIVGGHDALGLGAVERAVG